LLRDWGNPEPICVAGLFHSIYGTWHFRHKAFPIKNRSELAKLIGKEAEFLAYVFCVTERPKVFLANAGGSQISIHDYYANRPIQLSPADLSKLLEIEAANLIEQGGSSSKVLQQLQRTQISAAARVSLASHLADSSHQH
jgi:hypothetical protein